MAKIITGEYALDLRYAPFESMTDEAFLNFCIQNGELSIERDENHQILFMPPVTSEDSIRNSDLNADLNMWNRKLKSGLVFESTAGFFLFDTSMKSPDAAWVSKERWDALAEEHRKGFSHIVPDFVAELASPSDSMVQLKNKMKKWRDNGVQLGWLIDPKTETVFIYRADGTNSRVDGFDNILNGEMVLPGFEFRLEILR